MRTISSDLQAVQRVRSPRARVSVTVEARGQNPTLPALAWSELVGNAGQTIHWPTAAVGLPAYEVGGVSHQGRVIKFVAGASALKQYTIADPAAAASWTGATGVTRVTGLCAGVAALRIPGSSTLRLFYILGGNVYYLESADSGSGWGSAVTVYGGGDAAADLVVAYIADGSVANGPWFVGFSVYDGMTGSFTARFGYFSGGWITHAYGESGWRAAGIDAHAPAASRHRVLVFRQANRGTSRLRSLDKSGSSYTNPQDVDQTQAGHYGLELAFYRFCQLPEIHEAANLGAMAGVVGETAFGGSVYLGVGGVFTSGQGAGDPVADEPIIFPSIAATTSQAYPALCAAGDSLYLVGDTVVWRGVLQPAPAAVLEPITYTYADQEFDLTFAPTIPPLAVGQVLAITRTLSWGSQQGSATVRAIIVRVERSTEQVTVLALDALGWLGVARCRRPAILNDGSVGSVAQVMRRLGARFGLEVAVDNAALESGPVMPVTLAPAESLRGAAYRVGSQTEFYLVPTGDGSFGLTMITPGTSDSGAYADMPQVYGAAPSQQPVAQVGAVEDYRRLAFAYILGSQSTDPEDGAVLAMAAGPVIANTRPLSYSLTNMRYNTWPRVMAAANAEAARQFTLPITAWIEGQANLALELYDVVAVTEPRLGWAARQFRVRAMTERYDRGRLTQKVWLGEV